MPATKLTDHQIAEAIAMMDGKTTDAEIGREFGVSDQSIGRLRRKHGIAAVASPRLFQPTEAQLAELREASDKEMQRRYGHSKETWRRVRKRFNIPNFRPPTTINGVPNYWAGNPDKPKKPKTSFADFFKPSPIPSRDTSLAGEAAAFLQRERFTVFNRAKVGAGKGWQVGHSVLTADQLIAKAERLGFKQEEWMV